MNALAICYPYGQKESFSSTTIRHLKHPGFTCAFSTEKRVETGLTDRRDACQWAERLSNRSAVERIDFP
jgi:hypothetical protein